MDFFPDFHFWIWKCLTKIINKVTNYQNFLKILCRCIIYVQISFILDQSQVSGSIWYEMADGWSQLLPSTAMKKIIFPLNVITHLMFLWPATIQYPKLRFGMTKSANLDLHRFFFRNQIEFIEAEICRFYMLQLTWDTLYMTAWEI